MTTPNLEDLKRLARDRGRIELTRLTRVRESCVREGGAFLKALRLACIHEGRTFVQSLTGALRTPHEPPHGDRVERMRTRLLAERHRIFERVAHAEEDLRWLDTDVEQEVEEEGQEENIARLLAQLDERGKAEIEAVDQALRRIALGDYGRCRGCGAPIPWERLEAVPTASDCIACARTAEGPRP
jgi:RNA polymerase-binding transcription factor